MNHSASGTRAPIRGRYLIGGLLACLAAASSGNAQAQATRFAVPDRGATVAARAIEGERQAGVTLVSGQPAAFSIPSLTQPTLFTGPNAFLINVPTGSTRLEVRVTSTPASNVDLYVRFGADPAVGQDGFVIAQFFSESPGGNEVVTIDLNGWVSTTNQQTASPGLQPGNYHIALGQNTTGLAVSGTLVATVTGATQPAANLSGTWNWSALCSGANPGSYSGQFTMQQSGANLTGLFSDQGAISGSISGSTLNFSRVFGSRTQQWTGTVSTSSTGQLSLQGTVSETNPQNQCSFSAQLVSGSGGTGGGGGATGDVRVRINQEDNALCPAQKKLFVSVTDSQSQAIPGLAPSHFSLTENGQQRPVTVVCSTSGGAGSPGSIAVVIDVSSSLSNTDLTNEKNAAKQLVDQLGPSDSIAVYSFSDAVALRQNFTTDKNAARQAIDSLAITGSTALYAAIQRASQDLAARTGRKAIVLLTDGVNTITGTTLDQAIAAAKTANAPVFSVGFGSGIDAATLTRIASETGGFFSSSASSSDLSRILGSIGQVLVSQCEVIYAPASPTATTTVIVTVTVPIGGVTRTGSDTKSTGSCTAPTGGGGGSGGGINLGGTYICTFGATSSGPVTLTQTGTTLTGTLPNGGSVSGTVTTTVVTTFIGTWTNNQGTGTITFSSPDGNTFTGTWTRTGGTGDPAGAPATGTTGTVTGTKSTGGGSANCPSSAFTGNNVIGNGSFELPGGSTILNQVGSFLPCWTIVLGNIDYIGPDRKDLWLPSEGSYSLDIDGNRPGGVAQTFTAQAGQQYTVAFDLAGNYLAGANLKKLAVSVQDASLGGGQSYYDNTFSFDTNVSGPNGGRTSAANMGWQCKSFNFTPTFSRINLAFYSASSDPNSNWGAAVDNVRVVPTVAGSNLCGSSGGGGGGTGGGSGTGVGTTQPGCDYFVRPLEYSFGPAGGTAGGSAPAGSTFNPPVLNTTRADCRWGSVSNDSWITLEAGQTGLGSGAVSYRVAANPNATGRVGTVGIAGRIHTVRQSGGSACSYTLSPTSATIPAGGGFGIVTVTTNTQDCVWTAQSPDWITLASGGRTTAGKGTGQFRYSAISNSSPSQRIGTINVTGSRTFTVTQLAAGTSGDPTVPENAVVPAASGTPPSLPGGALAQGSFFTIFAFDVGPTDPAQVTAFPVPTNLGGTEVKFRQGSVEVSGYIVFSSRSQINGIVPSNAPLGDVDLTVIYQGKRSQPVRVRVVRNNFNIFTTAAGRGPGIVTNFVNQSEQPLNTRSIPAAPLQYITIWGTGGGPINASDAVAPPVGNLPFDFEVLVGDKPQELVYYGRSSCCSALDQVVIRLKSDVPLGCNVPLQVRAGGPTAPYSNVATLAISNTGRACEDPRNPAATIPQTGGKSGFIVLLDAAASMPIQSGGATERLEADIGVAGFVNTPAGGDLGYSTLLSLPPLGTCQAYNGNQELTSLLAGLIPSFNTGSASTQLNAGNQLTFTGPDGRIVPLPRMDPAVNSGPYLGLLGGSVPMPGVSPAPAFLAQGTFRISGPGGTDVGAFNTSVTLPLPLTWTNRDQLSGISRAQGFSINWSGGASDQVVIIAGGSTDQKSLGTAGFLCLAPGTGNSFFVPPSALTNLPLTRGTTNLQDSFGVVGVASISPGAITKFQATGIDLGLVLPLSLDLRTLEVRQ